MFINKDEMISNIELVKARIIDTTEIDNKISKLNDELQGLAKDIETLVKENTKTLKDQEIWKKKYAELEDSFKTKAAVLNDLTLKKKEKSLKANRELMLLFLCLVYLSKQKEYQICFDILHIFILYSILTISNNLFYLIPLFQLSFYLLIVLNSRL